MNLKRILCGVFVVLLFLPAALFAASQEKIYTNRLIHEKSPYLLQHAHNPVDWYPWGEEAFKGEYCLQMGA